MPAIALICYANRCRSVIAHAILVAEVRKRSLAIEVYSAGVADFSDQPRLHETAAACLRYNTPPPDKPPTWVAELPLDSIDRFLVMEAYHASVLMRDFKIASNRISLLGTFDPKQRGAEIADPFGGSELVYQGSYELIRDCINGYLDTTEDL